jgi:hypothetical protein
MSRKSRKRMMTGRTKVRTNEDQRMGLAIDPETLMISGGDRVFTAGQFALLVPPPCPVCGATVDVDRIDVTLNAEEEARRGRSYIIGRWECPHHCDPRTGQRRPGR